MKKIFNTLFSLAVLLGGFSLVSCEKEADALEGNLVLTASSEIFVANGEDELVLTAKVGDVDVTKEAKFYVSNQLMSSNVYTTTNAGNHRFFASYNGKISNQLTITAANPALYLELPEDSQPDKFDGFSHKVLLTQCTGTWCGYCPIMIRAIELFQETGSNAPNTVVVATHSGDDLSCKASENAIKAITANMSSAELNNFGFPSSFFSLNSETWIQNNDPTVNAENINTMAGMELRETARVGIAATVATTESKSVVAVRAAVKVGKAGSYRINAWLVEDSVSAYQSSYWEEVASGYMKHDHVLREAYCVSPIQGELLGGKASCEKGETFEIYHEFNIAEAGVSDAANCKVVVLVSSGADKKYFVNNLIECPVGESVPFAYNN